MPIHKISELSNQICTDYSYFDNPPMIRNVKTGNFHRHLSVQIGDLSKIGLPQAQEIFFLYNLQKTDL